MTTMAGTRLILTPKVPAPFGSVKWSPENLKKLDPDPDWGMDDLARELREIEKRMPGPGLPQNTPTAARISGVGGVSFRSVSKVADFGRVSKPFRMSAFDSDDESDSDEDVHQKLSTPVSVKLEVVEQAVQTSPKTPPTETELDRSPLLPKTDRVEAAILELERERLQKVQEEIRNRRSSFQELLIEEKDLVATKFAQLEKEEALKLEMARRSDKQGQRIIAEARDHHLSALQRDHEQRYQVEERRIRKEAAAEEARRRELAREREQRERAKAESEAEARRVAEIEKKKAEEEMAKRKAKAEAAAAAAVQRAKQEADAKKRAEEKALAQALVAAEKAKVPKPRVSEKALDHEEKRLKKLKELQDSYKQIVDNPALKKDLKVYERAIIKHLQQVSATQEQVRKKSAELIQTLQDPRGPPLQYMVVTFGSKILSQCESQIQKLPSFAFALAQVVVNVASQVPFVMESVLAQLHQVCIFTVPKYFVYNKSQFENDEAYYKLLGYKEEGGKLESTDDYVARMNAYITFYAAVAQTELQGGVVNPHGIAEAWAWCARLLNRIPANRLSASALESFLKIAGFRLYKTYPEPFRKLMNVVISDYLVSLKNNDDVDARAVVNRLETYLQTAQFANSPEGRIMPVRDISSALRA